MKLVGLHASADGLGGWTYASPGKPRDTRLHNEQEASLVIVNGTLYMINRDAQAEINTRQQFTQQSVQLEVCTARSSRRWPNWR